MAKQKDKGKETEATAAVETEGVAPESAVPAPEEPAVENDSTPEPSAPAPEVAAPEEERDFAVEAYDLFCNRQSEGDYPAWPELPEQTQKLWRDSYQYIADGGAPRTDYEHTVRYLIVSAQ